MKTEMIVEKNDLADDKPIANTAAIIEVATQSFKLTCAHDAALFAEAAERLDASGQILVMVAIKLMGGKPFAIASANPATIQRGHALASEIGASVNENYPGEPPPEIAGLTTLLFVPAPSAELVQMLEDVKKIAAESFGANGEMASRFILVFEGDPNRMNVPCGWANDEEKREVLTGLKRMIRQHGRLARYAYLAEVWASTDTDVRPTKSKNRTEHLMITAAERDALPIGGMFEIKRHALSSKPALGDWEDMSGKIQRSQLLDLFDDDDQDVDGASDAAPMSGDQPVMPAFVFQRHSHVEQEAGFILAGQLVVDLPKGTEPTERTKGMVQDIVNQLTAEARYGFMPADTVVCGWHGGAKPPNGVDIDNDDLMSAWVERSLTIAVRVDPRPPSDEGPRLDSDALAQMGLLKLNS
jgi:hypothetical protein